MRKVVPPERLFTALDGRELSVAGSACRLVVYGVFDEPRWRWIQLSVNGTRHLILTLRLRPSQKASEAVRELSTWLVNPSASRNVLQRVA